MYVKVSVLFLPNSKINFEIKVEKISFDFDFKKKVDFFIKQFNAKIHSKVESCGVGTYYINMIILLQIMNKT